MRKQTLLTALYFLVVLILTSAHLARAQSTGTFTVVKGDVTVTSANGTTEKAKVGKKVSPADVITAGPDSRAKIVMADKNVINISPDTKMAVEKYVFDPSKDDKQVTLSVVYGKVRATVEQKYDGEKNKFHIKTPAAVAGVRGTDFLTSFSAKTNETKIITFEGRVAVGMPGPQGQIVNPVFVNPGQMTTATVGTPPAPPTVAPKEEFNSAKTESQTEPAKNDSPKPESSNGGAEGGEKPGEKKDSAQSQETPTSDSGSTAKSDSSDSSSKSNQEGASQAVAQPESDGGKKREPASASASPASETRSGEPANRPPPPSAPSTSLLDQSDLAPTQSREVVSPLRPLPVPNGVTNYVPPTQNQQQYLNQTSQIIRNTNVNSKLNINIRKAP